MISMLCLRMIGSRLDRIDKKLPDFDLKIKDLKEEEDKVARCDFLKKMWFPIIGRHPAGTGLI